MKEIKIGVIGAGRRGTLAHGAHQPEKNVHLIAAADTNDKVLKEFKEKFGNDSYTTGDYRELLKLDQLDAVFICTPDYLHEEHGIAALEAGKSVYLEKPMGITIEQCDKLLETAYKTKSKLYLGHNMRHLPIVLKMKELIDAGVIGNLQAAWCRHFISYGGDAYYKDWHSEQKYTTSLLLQKGCHDIDVMHWLSGSYTERVVGMGKLSVYNRCENRRSPNTPGVAQWDIDNWPPLSQEKISPVIDVEDHNIVMMQLQNGVQCSYQQCHYTADSCRNYTFIGDAGRIENIGDHGNCEVRVYNRRSDKYNEPDIVHTLKPIEGSHGGGDPRIVNEFIDFIRYNKPTNTSPIAARFSVATGCRGAESLREGMMPKSIPGLSQNLIDYFENGQKE